MNTDKFKEKIYGPYLDAWKAIKILQEAYQKPELYIHYMEEVQKYADKYTDNAFAEYLRQHLLLHADVVVARMEREGL